MAKKNFKVNEQSKAIVVFDIAKLTQEDRNNIAFLKEMGYEFRIGEKKSRNSATKNREFYKANLYSDDYDLFECVAANHGYAKAVSWANTLIAMAQSGDEAAVQKTRDLMLDEDAKSFVFQKEWKLAHSSKAA